MSSTAEPLTDDLRARINRFQADLPPQQRLVADFCLDHLDDIPFLGVPALARRAGVSEATVVRLAQRLGYEGFAELKADLLEVVRRRVVNVATPSLVDAATDRRGDDALGEVARQELDNIAHTVDHLDREAFRAAAAALVAADHLYAFGLGISAHLARLLCYLSGQIGRRASVISTELSTPKEAVVALRASDALVVLSFPPYSRQSLELLRAAAERGVTTLAVCDRPSAPVGTAAHHALPVRSDNMMFTNSVAAASMLLNALVTEMAMQSRGTSVEAVSAITRILEADGGLLG